MILPIVKNDDVDPLRFEWVRPKKISKMHEKNIDTIFSI